MTWQMYLLIWWVVGFVTCIVDLVIKDKRIRVYDLLMSIKFGFLGVLALAAIILIRYKINGDTVLWEKKK